MDGTWILKRDFDKVVSAIREYEWPQKGLLIQPIKEREGETCFGLYVPTIPRPTSILAGELRVRRLEAGKVILEAINCFDWMAKDLEDLVQAIS